MEVKRFRLGRVVGGVVVAACLALFVSTTGCNRGPELPPLAKTTGTVTLDGKPVTTGVIVFVPDVNKGTDGSLGIGSLDDAGHYTIFTLQTEGAIVGHHKVRIEDPLGQSRAVPKFYSDPDVSGLTAEVKANQDNTIDFTLSTRH